MRVGDDCPTLNVRAEVLYLCLLVSPYTCQPPAWSLLYLLDVLLSALLC